MPSRDAAPLDGAADPDPEAVARAIALRRLTGRPQTRAQLADAMAARDVPDDAAARVLDRFTEVGLVDDAAFARAWVQSRQAGRGLARSVLARELRQRGVDGDVADEALGLVEPADEERAARELVQRKARTMQQLDPVVARRRLLGMLARRGYTGGLATRVVAEQLDGLSGPGGGRDDVEPLG